HRKHVSTIYLVTTATCSDPTLTHFFFQAEDGIRDGHVTGVQTCALPICSATPATLLDSPDDRLGVLVGRRSQPHPSTKVYRTGHVHRFSEERLVRSHGRGLLLHYSRRSSGLDDCGSMCALGSTAANGRCSVWNKT